MVTVITLIASARAGSRVKMEVPSKLYPLYGHIKIEKFFSLSMNDSERRPHSVKPSAKPQVLLTVSVTSVIKMF
jgi:hypothetical protein